jgi:hypothetical protein
MNPEIDLTRLESLEMELKKSTTSQDIDRFYTDQLSFCLNQTLQEAIDLCRDLFRLACAQGHLKTVVILMSNEVMEADNHDYFDICAQNNQLEILKYLSSVCCEECFSLNWLAVDFQKLYDQGLYEVFVFLLEAVKYRTDFDDALLSKLGDLKKHIETHSSYVSYVVADKYLTKVMEIILSVVRVIDIKSTHKVQLFDDHQINNVSDSQNHQNDIIDPQNHEEITKRNTLNGYLDSGHLGSNGSLGSIEYSMLFQSKHREHGDVDESLRIYYPYAS